jgi:hypothetical protein
VMDNTAITIKPIKDILRIGFPPVLGYLCDWISDSDDGV